jgi:hypothetical protein
MLCFLRLGEGWHGKFYGQLSHHAGSYPAPIACWDQCSVGTGPSPPCYGLLLWWISGLTLLQSARGGADWTSTSCWGLRSLPSTRVGPYGGTGLGTGVVGICPVLNFTCSVLGFKTTSCAYFLALCPQQMVLLCAVLPEFPGGMLEVATRLMWMDSRR